MTDDRYRFRTYLVVKTMEMTGCDWVTAMEAVASIAIESPEWDMDEQRTFPEWEAWERESRHGTTGGAGD